MDYSFLFYVAIILLSTKLLGLATKKVRMPQVVGALLAGIILGPAVLNVLHHDDFISKLSELGVIALMFTAGLETDIQGMKKAGKPSLVIALMGVVVPLVGGFVLATIFNNNGDPVSFTSKQFLENMFIGVVLTATSVSITVETLKEMGKLSTDTGRAILGAALIDDVLGIIALTIITSAADSSVNIAVVLLKIVLFFVLAVGAGYLFYRFFEWLNGRYNKDMRRFVILAFAVCLIFAFAGEHFFGVADITGAFIAGLILSKSKRAAYVSSRFDTLSYMLLSPIFFASIGINMELKAMTPTIIVFTVLIVLVAILTKIFGCGLGARLCKFSGRESLQIGAGMVTRGEVALIVANKGLALGLMSETFFAPLVIMVICTSIFAPILLKILYQNRKKKTLPAEG